MSNFSCWDLIEQNRFEEACQVADNEYKETNSIVSLRNKVIALLNLKKFSEAINLCNKIIDLDNGESEIDFKFCGVAYWLLNKHLEAIDVWKKGFKASYTDAAGGVELPLLLIYAAYKLNDSDIEKEAKSILKKIYKTKRAQNWPGPLAGYMLNLIDENEVINTIQENPISLNNKQFCQAKFYFGVKKIKENNEQESKKFFNEILNLKKSCYQKQEYYLAKAELEESLLK